MGLLYGAVRFANCYFFPLSLSLLCNHRDTFIFFTLICNWFCLSKIFALLFVRQWIGSCWVILTDLFLDCGDFLFLQEKKTFSLMLIQVDDVEWIMLEPVNSWKRKLCCIYIYKKKQISKTWLKFSQEEWRSSPSSLSLLEYFQSIFYVLLLLSRYLASDKRVLKSKNI